MVAFGLLVAAPAAVDAGRRGAVVSTRGSFSLKSGRGNRAGNDELGETDDYLVEDLSAEGEVTDLGSGAQTGDKNAGLLTTLMTDLAGYKTVSAPGAHVGPHLTGSGSTDWTSLQDCILTATSKGYHPGDTVVTVQHAGGKCYFYGPGDCGANNCQAGPETWRLEIHTEYRTVKAPLAYVGPHLTGSGSTAWTSLEDCIATAVSNGYEAGTTVGIVQHAGGKCYYYAPCPPGGNTADGCQRAGLQTWRVHPTTRAPASSEYPNAEYWWQTPASCTTPTNSNCTGTAFSSPGTKTGRFVFDLGGMKSVEGVALWKHSQAGSNGVKDFTVEVPASTSGWTTVKEFTSPQVPTTNSEKYTFDAVTTDKIAINYKSNHGHSSYTSFWELKFLGTGTTTNCFPIVAAHGSSEMGSCKSCPLYAHVDWTSVGGDKRWSTRQVDNKTGCGACPDGRIPDSAINLPKHYPDQTKPVPGVDDYITCHLPKYDLQNTQNSVSCKPDVTSGMFKGTAPTYCIKQTEVSISGLVDAAGAVFANGTAVATWPYPATSNGKTNDWVRWESITCEVWKAVTCSKDANNEGWTCRSAKRVTFKQAVCNHNCQLSSCGSGTNDCGAYANSDGSTRTITNVADLPETLQALDRFEGICKMVGATA